VTGGEQTSPGAPAAARDLTVILPRRGRVALDLGSVWRYRELLYFLVWRDLKVRYRQTLLGVAWAVIQPLVLMVLFSVIFGHFAEIRSDGLPYPIFAFAALVPWTFFSSGVSQASGSLVASQTLLKKVYFPRLVLPISAVLAAGVDLALAGAVLLAMMLVAGIGPPPMVLAVIPLLGLAFVTALGVGLWLSALNVRYRDVNHVVPFLLQVWLFATPVAYPASLLGEPWRTMSALNPMVGVVEGVRWGLVGANTSPGPLILVSTGVALLVLVTGALYFRRVEGTFADVV
jgi:lipopolysaccharide transport system permease protein